MKFGANFRRYDITDYVFSVRNNPEIFLGDATGNAGTIVGDPNYSDGGVLDFYNGTALQTRQAFPSRLTQPVALWGLGVYAQDEWKVRPNLTLTLALRAEKNSNPVCQTNCGSLLNAPFNTLLGAGLLSPTTPYNSIINGQQPPALQCHRRHRLGAPVRLCLVVRWVRTPSFAAVLGSSTMPSPQWWAMRS